MRLCLHLCICTIARATVSPTGAYTSAPFIQTARSGKSLKPNALYALLYSRDLPKRSFYSAQSYGFTKQVERAVFNFLKFKSLEQMLAHVATVEDSK